MSEPYILLYAELLANIRQIRLFVTTRDSQGSSGQSPELSLSSSRSVITVSHFDQTLSLQLPRPVSEKCLEHLNTARSAPQGSENEYTFRLPLDEPVEPSDSPSGSHYAPQSPWTAKDMDAQARICCRGCSGVLAAPSDNGTFIWKDLPSADWAEMMDLWHCHKPDPIPEIKNDHEPGDMNDHTKGYGATNRVVCESGTVLVNVSSFIMARSDCQGVKQTEGSSHGPHNHQDDTSSRAALVTHLSCTYCGASVGEENLTFQGLELFKTKICVLQDNGMFESYPPEIIVGSQILEGVERSGARRFAIHGNDGSDQQDHGLLVWIFNTDMSYSYNSELPEERRIASKQRAMKVFYQHVSNMRLLVNPGLGEPSATSVEELKLPTDLYQCVKGVLEKSTNLLPSSGRKFKDWEVGLLDLFEGTSDVVS